jgi:hypothetical protein
MIYEIWYEEILKFLLLISHQSFFQQNL